MFVGAYWSQRQESREESAKRIVLCLSLLKSQSELFAEWFMKARTKAAAFENPLSIDLDTVASTLRVDRRDVGGEAMPELGFSLSVWNGKNASFTATVGVYSPYVRNAVLLSFDESPTTFSADDWKALLEAMIRAFEPDHAVVTSHEHLDRVGAEAPWESGWFTYQRGGEIQEGPFE
ncbi:MAG: hypothetical protein MJE77_25120 [Proteobacteria bacterium]|nr:hypothetical protein [Pseudomonadota bacterium]